MIVLISVLTSPCLSLAYAVLIGVRTYPRTEFNSLQYSENDVVELAKVLRSKGYKRENIELLTHGPAATDPDKSPTIENIRSSIRLMLSGLDSQDTILIAFSGHGVQFEGDPTNYFCPIDGKLERRSTLISISDVFQQLEKCGASGRVLFVDACRDNPQSTLSRSSSLRIRLEPVTARKLPVLEGGTAAFFSFSATQQAFEDPKLKNGVFFHFLIKGLSGKADLLNDGDVTFSELVNYTKKKVKDYVRSELRQIQLPEQRGSVKGDILIVSNLAPGQPSRVASNRSEPPNKPATSSKSTPSHLTALESKYGNATRNDLAAMFADAAALQKEAVEIRTNMSSSKISSRDRWRKLDVVHDRERFILEKMIGIEPDKFDYKLLLAGLAKSNR